jgi:hypothetical protein
MKKRIFTVLILLTSINCGTFAQEVEKLTFVERRTDGTITGTVTVDAIFVYMEQHKISIEGGLQVTYSSAYYKDEWSDWELVSRQPAMTPTIRQLYDIGVKEWTKNPRASVRINMGNGIQAVRIGSIPKGKSTPFWWSDDGKSFYIFFEVYAIMP